MVEPFVEPEAEDLLALDEALTSLQTQDHRMSQIVQLRCFAGLTTDEIAQALDISARTVTREWRVATVWLRAEMERGHAAGA